MKATSILVVSSALLGLWGLAGPAAAAEPTGAAFCVTCHDSDDLPDMSRSAHGFAADSRAPDCISCHGASDTHAHKPSQLKERPRPDFVFGGKAGRGSANTAEQRSERCLSCHGRDSARALWSGSQHPGAEVACDSCHKVHANRDRALDKSAQTDLCVTCHKAQRSQFARPSHHPVPEGRMSCSDCHNVHGSTGPKLMRHQSINTTCYTCHAEKRGPFVHQHTPVVEDCGNCHNPHGSSIASMLTARAPMLCQQCHTPHVGGSVGIVGSSLISSTNGKNTANIWQGRSCMNCHTQVHGSNNPSTLNPTPQLLGR